MSIFVRFALLSLALVPAAGCYTYAAADLDALDRDAAVRARITAEGVERLEPLLRQDDVLTGRVAELRPDALVLAVTVPAASPGAAGTQTLRQFLTIPRGDIRAIELRRLHTGRTAGLVVGSTALLGFILYQALVRDDPPGSSGENGPPVNQDRGAAAFRLPFPSF